jgi:hypothetical protein
MSSKLTDFYIPDPSLYKLPHDTDTDLPHGLFTDDEFCQYTCKDVYGYTGGKSLNACFMACDDSLKDPEIRALITRTSKENDTVFLSDSTVTGLFQSAKFCFYSSSALLSAWCFKKAVSEKKSLLFIRDIAFANIGLLGTLYCMPVTWETSLLTATGLTCTTAIMRLIQISWNLCKDVNPDRLPSQSHHRKTYATPSYQSPRKHDQATSTILVTEQPKMTSPTQKQEEEICALLQNLNLDPCVARQSLTTLQNKIFSNPTNSDPFTIFKDRVKDLVQQHCFYCGAKNEFTGDCFEKILQLCPRCRTVMYCQNQICKKAFWIHRQSCRPVTR